MSLLAGVAVSVTAGTACATNDSAESVDSVKMSSDSASDNSMRVDSVAALLWHRFKVAKQESALIAKAVISSANEYTVSPVLLLAIIATESGFDRQAVSVAGAQGLMQILPAAHPQLVAESRDLTEPAENVRIGSSILRGYLDASGGDLNAALRRYSGGGRGYAERVALHMRQLTASLHAPTDNPAIFGTNLSH